MYMINNGYGTVLWQFLGSMMFHGNKLQWCCGNRLQWIESTLAVLVDGSMLRTWPDHWDNWAASPHVSLLSYSADCCRVDTNNCTAHILLAAWQREVLGILVELVPQPANCRDWRGVSYPVLGDLHQSPTPVNDLSIGNVERCLNFKDLQGIFLESEDVYGYLRDNPIHICNLWQRSKKTWRKTKWNNWNNQRFPVICSLNQPIEQIRGKDRKKP